MTGELLGRHPSISEPAVDCMTRLLLSVLTVGSELRGTELWDDARALRFMLSKANLVMMDDMFCVQCCLSALACRISSTTFFR